MLHITFSPHKRYLTKDTSSQANFSLFTLTGYSLLKALVNKISLQNLLQISEAYFLFGAHFKNGSISTKLEHHENLELILLHVKKSFHVAMIIFLVLLFLVLNTIMGGHSEGQPVIQKKQICGLLLLSLLPE